MPYADDKKTGKPASERKKEAMRNWRKRSIEAGYGKWLYKRRKLRFDDAERFRDALEGILELSPHDLYGNSAALEMQEIAKQALRESQQAEKKLGSFTNSKS